MNSNIEYRYFSNIDIYRKYRYIATAYSCDLLASSFRLAHDVFKYLKNPKHKNKDLVISCSYFEIYGAKVRKEESSRYRLLYKLRVQTSWCDQAFDLPVLGGKMIEYRKFYFIKTKFERKLSGFFLVNQ